MLLTEKRTMVKRDKREKPMYKLLLALLFTGTCLAQTSSQPAKLNGNIFCPNENCSNFATKTIETPVSNLQEKAIEIHLGGNDEPKPAYIIYMSSIWDCKMTESISMDIEGPEVIAVVCYKKGVTSGK